MSDNETLSNGQQAILLQRLRRVSRHIRANNIPLWSQCPLPKHNNEKEDQGPPITSKKADTTLQINMDIHNRSEPISLRATKRKRNK